VTTPVRDGHWFYGEQPLPCDGPDTPGVDTRVEPRYIVGVVLDSEGVSAALTEEIRSFSTAEDADRYFALVVDGLGCGHAQVDDGTGHPTELTIGAAIDVAEPLAAEQASQWTMHSTDAAVTFVAALAGREVVEFYFATAAGEDVSSLDPPLDVAATGLAKVLAAQ